MATREAINLSPREWLASRRRGLTLPQVTDMVEHLYFGDIHEETPPAPATATAEPYTPDFTLIPDQLAKYAEADESAEDFRVRAFSLLFRFGIADGEHFEGAGPLSADEKIMLLPMLIANFEAGNWLGLTEDLKP